MALRVLLADDRQILLDGLSSILERLLQFEAVGRLQGS